jgi:hypothetical protein
MPAQTSEIATPALTEQARAPRLGPALAWSLFRVMSRSPAPPPGSRFRRRGARNRLAVERFDGEPVTETEAMLLLVEAGFLASPRRAVLRP